MFDLGWTELLLVVVVAIVVIGPKDLPRALRAVGRWTGKARRMAGDFQRQFNEVVREADLEDVKKSVTELGKIDPLGDIRKEMSKAEADIKSDLQKATKLDEPAAKTEPAPAVTAEAAPAGSTAVAEKPATAPAPVASGATAAAEKPATEAAPAVKAPAKKKPASTKAAAPKKAAPKKASATRAAPKKAPATKAAPKKREAAKPTNSGAAAPAEPVPASAPKAPDNATGDVKS